MTFVAPSYSNPLTYAITKSLRFRSGASAYLSRTPASTGSRTTWTWSGWVKRGAVDSSTSRGIFGVDGSSYMFMMFNNSGSNNELDCGEVVGSQQWRRQTSQVFRDVAGWYHIVLAFDSTQATASNRVKLYVNGTQVTAFSSSSDPSLNYNSIVNTTAAHSIGRVSLPTGYYFDGYLTEVNFIDGQALTPSSFGQTGVISGVWEPIRYAGTYGTNGFYLPFKTSNSDNIVVYYPGTLSGSSVVNVEGVNGTKGSGVTSTTGKVGTGFAFDGTTNGYIDTGISTNYTTAFTTCMWFKTTSSTQSIIVNKSSFYAENTSAFPFRAYLGSGGGVSITLDSGNGDYTDDFSLSSSTSGYNDGNWHHLAIVYQAASFAKIYVDGVEVATSSLSLTISTVAYNWFIGRASLPYGGGVPGLPYTGSIDDFRLYSKALSASEILSIYNGVSTQVGIGSDASGNDNSWSPINISLTPGTTYDSMTDVPTLTNASVSNFAVLNPLNGNPSTGSSIDGNLTGYSSSSGEGYWNSSIDIPITGKWYWEAQFSTGGSGIRTSLGSTSMGTYSVFLSEEGKLYINGTNQGVVGSIYSNTDIMGVAVDTSALTIKWYKNGSLNYTYTYTAQSLPFFAFIGKYSSTSYINFGQRPFAYTLPAGYKTLNNFNLPEPSIIKANKFMDATTYTGTGANPQTITNQSGFQPDMVWQKSRSGTTYHQIADSIRGANKFLYPNVTNSEETDAINGYLTAFNSNGFSVTAGSNSGAAVNANGTTYVAWQWQAGKGTTSTNTDGSMTSSVSVNRAAGFSIATFTTPSGHTSGTIGHGLGVTPSMVIVKNRNGTTNRWHCYHTAMGNTKAMYLELTNAETTSSAFWNNTSPTSSVFTIGSNFYASADHVALCWAPIAGYSAFGSYTGNGSADGTFVYTGFRPRWILIKRSSDVTNWRILDTARDPYNIQSAELYPNTSGSEGSYPSFDGLSNGFKIRNYDSAYNASGGTYIYAAFAENPFKYSLAR